MIPNSEYGPEWALAVTLASASTSNSGFGHEMYAAFWIGQMIRRFALKNPKLDEVFMSIEGWTLILTRQARPEDPKVHDVERSIQEFFRCVHFPGPNPWGVATKNIPYRWKGSTVRSKPVYRVTRILPPEIQIERLFPEFKETEAYKKFAAACEAHRNRILTVKDMQEIMDRQVSSLDRR
jgi:hypothetical protein